MTTELTAREAPASYVLDALRVRPGYKQTEVGVIPEDWEAVPIGSLGSFSKGQGIRKNEAASGDIPCVRYGEIYTHHNDHVRAFNSFISSEVAQTSKKLRKGDLLFAGSGETKEEIGKCVAFVDDIEAYAGGDIVILSPSRGCSLFFGYLFNAPVVARQKASKGQGDAVVHISATALSSVKIPLPPTKAEQEAIAEALSDAVTLIEALEQLIAKKRHLKQGAMQELLTGKKRLPGFEIKPGYKQTEVGEIPVDWRIAPIEEISTVGRGRVISHREIDRARNPQYPVYSSQTSNDGVMGYLGTFEFEGEYITWTTDGANAGTVFARSGRFNCTNVCGTIKLKIDNHIFVAKILGKIAPRHVSRHLGNPKLMNDVMKKVKIPLPSSLPEQTAIATILSDMDTEIAALEARLAKTRSLKQGMMHNLLTGKIRLV